MAGKAAKVTWWCTRMCVCAHGGCVCKSRQKNIKDKTNHMNTHKKRINTQAQSENRTDRK